ncbi:MAG: UbiA family prenyltransferase [Actinomycetota bacterium]|nr:UbiA family prenyltransferase [Actinomycetota bacterium]
MAGKPVGGGQPLSRGAGSTGALLAASHPGPSVVVTGVAVALAAAEGRSAPGLAAVGAAVLSGQLSVGWHNDWLDAERDRLSGRGDKPVAQGAVPRRLVGRAAAVAVVAVIPLSLLSGPEAAAAHLAAVALAWAYNARLKATVLSFAPYAVAFALLVTFVSLGLPGAPGPPWWQVVAAALLGTGAHLANAAPDLDDDRATGVRGLPHRLGYRVSVLGAATLLVIASAVLAFGAGRPRPVSAGGLALAVLVVGAGLVAGRRGRPRLLFAAAMLVALIDVALLVAESASG